MGKLHKVDELAEYLGCTSDQIRRLLLSGDLVGINIGSGPVRKCIRVPDTELQAFLQRRTMEQPASRPKPQPKPKREWV